MTSGGKIRYDDRQGFQAGARPERFLAGQGFLGREHLAGLPFHHGENKRVEQLFPTGEVEPLPPQNAEDLR